MKFKVAVRPKGSSNKATVQEVNAGTEEELKSIFERMNLEIVEVIESVDVMAETHMDNMSTNQILQMGLKKAAYDAAQAAARNPQPLQQVGAPDAAQLPAQQERTAKPKEVFFSDGSNSYKIIDGKPFKKAWVEHKASDFRVIRNDLKAPKILDSDTITIERLDWIPVEEINES
jgi:hypothetical protein